MAQRWPAQHTTEWKRLIGWLNERFPVAVPVRVVRYPLRANEQGGTWVGEKSALIRIAARLPLADATLALLEEWAHARDLSRSRVHGPAWALEHGTIREAYDHE